MGSFGETSIHALLIGLTLAVVGCSNQDYSTPRATIETAQDALRENDAERLYQSFSKDWRRERLDRWQSRIETLPAKNSDGSATGITRPGRMNGSEVLARYLEKLRQSRRTNELLKQYANTDFRVRRRNDTTAVVKVQSRFPLPYERGYLRRIDGLWKIDGVE